MKVYQVLDLERVPEADPAAEFVRREAAVHRIADHCDVLNVFADCVIDRVDVADVVGVAGVVDVDGVDVDVDDVAAADDVAVGVVVSAEDRNGSADYSLIHVKAVGALEIMSLVNLKFGGLEIKNVASRQSQ